MDWRPNGDLCTLRFVPRKREERLERRRWALVIFAALQTCCCYTTLDPTRLDGNGSGGSPDVLPTCSFVESGSHRYTVCPSPLSQAAASTDCERRQAGLVAIESLEENELVSNAAFPLVNTNLWLGGTRNDELIWSWPDGSVFWRGGSDGSAELGAFVRWQAGEPNNSSTVTTDPERCMVLTVADFDWNDRSCSLALPYVCEQKL